MKTSYIAFDSKEAKTQTEMWADIAKMLEILIRNKYICVVRYEDCGIYLLEYGNDDESYGTPYPYWMTPEQYETVDFGDGEDG